MTAHLDRHFQSQKLPLPTAQSSFNIQNKTNVQNYKQSPAWVQAIELQNHRTPQNATGKNRIQTLLARVRTTLVLAYRVSANTGRY